MEPYYNRQPSNKLKELYSLGNPSTNDHVGTIETMQAKTEYNPNQMFTNVGNYTHPKPVSTSSTINVSESYKNSTWSHQASDETVTCPNNVNTCPMVSYRVVEKIASPAINIDEISYARNRLQKSNSGKKSVRENTASDPESTKKRARKHIECVLCMEVFESTRTYENHLMEHHSTMNSNMPTPVSTTVPSNQQYKNSKRAETTFNYPLLQGSVPAVSSEMPENSHSSGGLTTSNGPTSANYQPQGNLLAGNKASNLTSTNTSTTVAPVYQPLALTKDFRQDLQIPCQQKLQSTRTYENYPFEHHSAMKSYIPTPGSTTVPSIQQNENSKRGETSFHYPLLQGSVSAASSEVPENSPSSKVLTNKSGTHSTNCQPPANSLAGNPPSFSVLPNQTGTHSVATPSTSTTVAPVYEPLALTKDFRQDLQIPCQQELKPTSTYEQQLLEHHSTRNSHNPTQVPSNQQYENSNRAGTAFHYPLPPSSVPAASSKVAKNPRTSRVVTTSHETPAAHSVPTTSTSTTVDPACQSLALPKELRQDLQTPCRHELQSTRMYEQQLLEHHSTRNSHNPTQVPNNQHYENSNGAGTAFHYPLMPSSVPAASSKVAQNSRTSRVSTTRNETPSASSNVLPNGTAADSVPTASTSTTVPPSCPPSTLTKGSNQKQQSSQNVGSKKAARSQRELKELKKNEFLTNYYNAYLATHSRQPPRPSLPQTWGHPALVDPRLQPHYAHFQYVTALQNYHWQHMNPYHHPLPNGYRFPPPNPNSFHPGSANLNL